MVSAMGVQAKMPEDVSKIARHELDHYMLGRLRLLTMLWRRSTSSARSRRRSNGRVGRQSFAPVPWLAPQISPFVSIRTSNGRRERPLA